MASSGSSGTNMVVWEWEFSANVWLPYHVEAVHLIEDSYLSGKQLVKLGGSLGFYEIDLKNMTQTRIDTGTLRQVRRHVYPTNSLPGKGKILWDWDGDYDWVPYDVHTACALEKAREMKQSIVDLSKTQLNIPNTVDLKQMEQRNHLTQNSRQVRRSKMSKSYPIESSSESTSLPKDFARQLSTGKCKTVISSSGFAANSSAVSSSSLGAQSNSFTLSAVSSPASPSPLPTSSQTSTALAPPSPISNVWPATSCGVDPDSKQIKKLKTKHSTQDNSDPLSVFCSTVQTVSDEECSICFDKLSTPSNFGDDSASGHSPYDIKQLDKCRHLFHSLCLKAMYNSGTKDGSLQCPVCKTIHGVKHGTQPSTGTMHVTKSKHPSLPGHPGCGTIIINYDFTPGIQGPEHPNAGKRFKARGFPRVCYLPDSDKGRKVLRLLRTAWARRLIFTIGTSNTSGQQDTVVWNEIHHKTEAFSNHSGHGYPDPNYLDNVLAELAAHGVEEDEANTKSN